MRADLARHARPAFRYTERFLSGVLALLLLFGSQAYAAVEKVRQVEGVAEYRLDNGLRILLAADPSRDSTTVNITYLVGSRHEGYGETGMAHLLEHLLFKGTPTHPNIPAELTRRGMRSNGTTWFDRTNYFETFAASEESLDWALRMEADRMVNSFVARKDLDSEMTVVRNELERAENDNGRILTESVMATAYRWHNYGKRVLGARSDIENVAIDNLQAFYRKHYRPDNAVLLVAGSFDVSRTLAAIERHFAPIPRPVRPITNTYTAEPAQEGERHVQLGRIDTKRMLQVLYHVPPTLHPDTPALELALHVLSANPHGRLYKTLVQSGKASGTWAWQPTLYEPGFVTFGAELRKEDDPASVRKLLLENLEGLAARPMTAEELERARGMVVTRWEKSLTDLNTFGIGLSEYIAAGDWRLFFLKRRQYADVSLADVNRVVQTYFKPHNRTTGELVPLDAAARVDVPRRADLDAALNALPPESALAIGEAFDASPANIEARTDKSKLANGLEMALLPKKTRGETVQLQFVVRFGDADNLRGRGVTANLAAAMLVNGTAQRDRANIAAEMERLNSRVSVRQAGQSIILTAETRRQHLPALLGLIRELLLEPSFPQEELSRLIRQRVAAARDSGLQPATLASRALARHLTPYPADDIRYAPDENEYRTRVADIDREELATFWREYVGGGHAYFAAVGDFDVQALKTLMAGHFSAWSATQRYAALPEPWQQIPAMTSILRTPDKQNASLEGGLRVPVGERSAEYPALLVATRLLGGGFLSSRLATRIRQKEGLSYTVNTRLSSSSGTANGVLYVTAIYAPQNRARIEAAVREELQRLFAEGFSEAELADAKNALLESRRLARTQDATLAGDLAYNLRLKRSFQYAAEQDAKLAALTLEELNGVVRKHLDPARLSLVFAGDFSGAAP